MREQRRQHVEAVAKRADVHRFYFLVETVLRLDYTRLYGRAPSGRRAGRAVPLRRGKSLILIGALGVRGLKAVQLLEGALNQRSFAFYIRRILAPQLRDGDMLVLDNLPVHMLAGLQQKLARHGVEVLLLPPYSPDFTPVEQAWSKLNTKLREAQACTRQALDAALQTPIDWITSTDALGWFNHCSCHVHRS
ncbi:transposase [Hymenobacter terrestris]|uniref:Transposase n=1 Tax=Hymenobacter terrestris TaxID=2748310 RepID=A0ABX2Q805_9BACT|nr:transposase [Hymenobacter terrestris]NVO86101.1 transposase [Hymenobacter terrestris]